MEILDEKNEKQWKDFISKQSCVPPQSTISWKNVISKTYKNCEPIYYINIKDKIVKTIFPFFLVKSKIFGNRLISQPFIDIGGPLGEFDKNFIIGVIENLKRKFEKDLKGIEIRINNFLSDYEKICECLLKEGFKEIPKKNQLILELENEEILWNKFDRITKKGIKKAKKSRLEIREIKDKKEITNFYKLYLNNMKHFGVPQNSLKFFLNLSKSEIFKGLNCYKERELVASIIGLYTKDYIYIGFNVSKQEYLKYRANDLLYWEIIKWAIKKGIKYFDFGQCEANAKEGTHAAGIYKFKKKWLGKLYNKTYFYYSLEKKSEDGSLIKENKKDKLIETWKKLPSSVIKILGPKICSQLAL